MSNYDSTPITQLPPAVESLPTDIFPAVDTTDFAESPSGTTKKYTVNQLQTYVTNTLLQSNILSARAASVGNLNATYVNGIDNDGIGATLSNAGALAALVIDGVTLNVNDRVLVSFQSTPTQNGVYSVTNTGNPTTAWVMTRVTDYDNHVPDQIISGDFIGILEGAINSLTFWFETAPTPLVIGTDPITFQKQTVITSSNVINQTTNTATLNSNTVYICNAGASLITFLLPPVSAVGDYIDIIGKDAGLFLITQDVNQQIFFGATPSTIGVTGSLGSQIPNNALRLNCVTANTEWVVSGPVGSFNIL